MPLPPPSPGPHPLPLHLGLASLIWLSWPLLWQHLQNASLNSKPDAQPTLWHPNLQQKAARLAAASAKLPSETWTLALAAEGLRRYGDYLKGLKNYRAQPAPHAQERLPLLQQIGSSRLLDIAPQHDKTTPCLLVVPSLVNRPDILHLSTDYNLLRWLAGQGIRPLLVDWGRPTAPEAQLTLADYLQRLQQFLTVAQRIAGTKVHLFGHCLGGNLALAVAALAPSHGRSLVVCSTPWDFHAGNPAIRQQGTLFWQALAPALPPETLVPPALLQGLFTLLQPLQVTDKFRRQGQVPMTAAQLQHFCRVEQWLNDGVPITRPVLQEIIQDWYGTNLPCQGGWQVRRQPIRPQDLRLPVLVAVPEQDHIVPPASALALARQVPGAIAYSAPLGHIGMIISHRAPATSWRRFAAFIKEQHRSHD